MLWVALHLPSLPAGSLEPIAAWACQFTPRVSLEPPRELALEVEGSLRYFGGMEAFLGELRTGLEAMGHEAAIGVAATARAALWLARGGGSSIENLPVEVACAGEVLEFLKGIGIAKIKDLLQLPREGLARRCGQGLLDDIERAFGRLPEPRSFFAPPPRFAATLELPAEVMHAEGLLFAARRLLVQLEGLLKARQAGIYGFTLFLHQRRRCSEIEIRFASPTRDVDRFVNLLRERLAAFVLCEPVEVIRVEAGDFVPLAGASGGLFGDAAAEEEDWARLVERLRARLGRDAVCRLATHSDHRPERAWRFARCEEKIFPKTENPGPRPAWLLEPPRRLEPGGFVLLAGPERIESGWWDGDEARRDYFIARLGELSLAWIYREAGEWYLHGLFA